LAGVTATLTHYLKNEAEMEVPVWQMITRPLETIKTSADNWREYLGRGEVIPGFSTVGGGSLPTEEMPTYLLALSVEKPDDLLRALRAARPPIIARIENDLVLFDPRTVFKEQEAVLLRNVLATLDKFGG
jgi:L-seryl-tRNA(Ser) seleniumtransferase